MFHLEKGEKLIAEVRRHWFVIFAEGLIFFLVAIAPIVFYGIFKLFIDFDISLDLGGNTFFFFAFIYLVLVLALWVVFFIQWTNYYLDIWYVTDKRILDIEQRGLFSREVITIRYDQIQDITIDISGIIATILNFGDIHVQSAGIGREIILKQASSPDKTKKVIMSLHNEAIARSRVVKIDED